MKNQFQFFGISSPDRREIDRELFKENQPTSQAELSAIVKDLWKQPERELQYLAMELCEKNRQLIRPGFLLTAKYMIVNKSWWDTVDIIAQHLVSPLVRDHPSLIATMDTWIRSENIWLARTAILFQNPLRAKTNAPRLFRYCKLRASDTDFFIRKAIGWALREYAKTDPKAVKKFVRDNRSILSTLSQREALKNIR